LQLGSAEIRLEASINGLFAVAEDYPELKASEGFLRLQTRITNLEDSISERREFYNETVAINNSRVQQFPDNLIASFFSFKEFEQLEFSLEELKDVDIAANY